MEFILTADGFYLDETAVSRTSGTSSASSASSASAWQNRFIEDKYKALYDLGFENADNSEHSASFSFLKLLADRFVEFLMSMPELELKHLAKSLNTSDSITDNTSAGSSKNIISCESILNSIPFVIGSEFITEAWIQKIFKNLIAIFRACSVSSENMI